MQPVIDINGLSVTLTSGARGFTLEIPALRVAPGERVAFTGPSGTGKTLLLELLGLLRAPGAGRYLAALRDGAQTDLGALWKTRRGRAQIPPLRGRLFGFVPQTGGLLPFLDVRGNIALSQRISARPDAELIEALIGRLGLGPVARLHPDRLSIGQRQRVSIARALAHRPRFVIADEPTAALDPENAAEAMALLFGAADETGTAVVVSSHDLELLDSFALTRYRLGLIPDTDPDRVTSQLAPLEASASRPAATAGPAP